jgi:DNA-binding response OmpR family regulator
LRILLVEDDPKIGQFVVTALKQAGFAVDRTQNGEDGLQLALSTHYDIAIVDIMLPGLSNLAV